MNTSSTVIADRFLIQRFNFTGANTLLIFLGVGVLALLSQISIPLPFSPVPITGQTLGVMLIGACYGSKRGALTTGLYAGGGIMGLPIFAGGTAGMAKLFGPTGGYLIGFVLASYLMGKLAERQYDRKLTSAFGLFFIGQVAIYFPGLLWLSFYIPADKVLAMGFFPFIPGAILKMAIAAMLLPAAQKIIDKA